MKDASTSLTYLFIESVAEQHNVDEGKIKDFVKRTAVPVALGAMAYGGFQSAPKTPIKKKAETEKVSTVGTKKVPTEETEEVLPHKEILMRQAFKESGFNPEAVSPRGAKGLTQIMPSALIDYSKITGKKPENINLGDTKSSIDVQVKTMKNLYNASFINVKNEKQSEIVRLAKTLAAYNYGRGNLYNFLDRLKKEGKDVYTTLDWVTKLPKETRDYVNKILFKKDSDFEIAYEEAIQSKENKKIVDIYNNIDDLNK